MSLSGFMSHFEMAAIQTGRPLHQYLICLQTQMASAHIMKSASSGPITDPIQFGRGWNFVICGLYLQGRKVTGLLSCPGIIKV